MKTKGIYGNELVITQTAHGTQNKKAIDSVSPLIAMEDVFVYDYKHINQWHSLAKTNTEQESYFYVRMFNSNDYFIVVHARPTKTGLIKAGERVGEMFPYWSWKDGGRADHFHTCANVKGVGWIEPPAVLDRSVVLKWPWGDHWSTKYSSYKDVGINLINNSVIIKTGMVKINPTIYILDTTSESNLRSAATIDSSVITKLPAKADVTAVEIWDGQLVGTNSNWLKVVYKEFTGFISATLVKQPELAINQELIEARKTISDNILAIELLNKQTLELNKVLHETIKSRDDLLVALAEKDALITALENKPAEPHTNPTTQVSETNILTNLINKFFAWISRKKE